MTPETLQIQANQKQHLLPAVSAILDRKAVHHVDLVLISQ